MHTRGLTRLTKAPLDVCVLAVIAKMQRSHLQLLDMLTSDLRFAGIPADALVPLTSLRSETQQREASWFNSTNNYRDATNRALQTQEVVFNMLADEGALAQKMDKKRLERTALLAARAGEHDLALELLLQARSQPGAIASQSAGHGSASAPAPSTPVLRSKSTTCFERNLGTVANGVDWDAYDGRQRQLFEVALQLLNDGLQQPWPGASRGRTVCLLWLPRSESARRYVLRFSRIAGDRVDERRDVCDARPFQAVPLR